MASKHKPPLGDIESELARLLVRGLDQDEANIIVLEFDQDAKVPPDEVAALRALVEHSLRWDELAGLRNVAELDEPTMLLAAVAFRRLDKQALKDELAKQLEHYVPKAVRFANVDWYKAGWRPGMRGYPK